MLICVICGALFSSCDRRELTYYATAEATITADWSKANMDYEKSYGSTVIFYPQDGGEPKVVLMGDRTFETARLPEGRYDAILFNRSFDDFANIAFRGLETLKALEVYAVNVETRNEEKTGSTRAVITDSPEKIAVAVIRDFEVTEDMLGNYGGASTRSEEAYTLHFTPCELTRGLHVRVNIKGVSNIKNAKCSISGVPLSVFLCNGERGGVNATQEFTLGNVVLDEGSFKDGYAEGTVNVFGFSGDIPHNIRVSALLVDGVTLVEQTATETKIAEKENGDGTVSLYIEARLPDGMPEVKPENGTDSSFDANVDEWGEEEDEDIIL